MKEQYSRTALLFGEAAVERLRASRVAVFGIGGVGGAAAEALARAGVGEIDLIDSDCVSESNINRQIIALHSTVGRPKTEVCAERIADIDPDTRVNLHNMFFLPENCGEIDFSAFEYVIDAIDTVSGKLSIIECAVRAGVPVISSMGTGNKVDPSALRVSDIYKTSVCPLAKVIRKGLKDRGIKDVKVLYSREEPVRTGLRTPASVSFVPSAAGLIIAGEVIKDLIGAEK